MTARAIERLKQDFPTLYEWVKGLDEAGCLFELDYKKHPKISFGGTQPLPKLPDTCEAYGIDTMRAGLAVIDLDRNHADGSDGVSRWKALAAKHGVTEGLVCGQKTPSGGYHRISLAPRGRGVKSRNDLGKLNLGGIDIKASGLDGTKHAFFVGFGSKAYSKQDGEQTKKLGVYWPTRDVLPQDDFPIWFLDEIARREEMLAEAERKEAAERYAASGVTLGTLTKFKQKILDSAVAEMAATSKGSIDSTMNSLIFQLGKRGVSWDDLQAPFFSAAVQAGATPGHVKDSKWRQTWERAFASYNPAEDPDWAVNPPAKEFAATDSTFAKVRGERSRATSASLAPAADDLEAKLKRYTPDDFFAKVTDKDGTEKSTGNLLALTTAEAVLDLGPIMFGRDGFTWEYSGGVYKQSPKVIESRLARLFGDRFRGGYIASVEPQVRVNADTIDCEPVPQYINFKNGLLDWEQDELVEHTPDVRTTVQLTCDWNPDAECPEFEKFLKQVVPADVIPTLWELIGYSLYSGNPLQTAVMLVGEGGNGKGTFLRVIQGILGQHNVAGVSLHELSNDRFATADLFGKVANIAADIDGTFIANTAEFKKMTGGDLLRAQHKGLSAFGFVCWALPLFSANTIPGSADTSDGYFRRWLIIKFPNQITKKDSGLDARLAREYEGIAAKAVLALRDLMKRQKWMSTPSLDSAKREFERKVDHIRDFLDAMTVPEPVAKHCSSPILTFDQYMAWCDENNHKHPLSKQKFYTRVEQAGHPRVLSNGSQKFQNLRLKSADELAQELKQALGSDEDDDWGDLEREVASSDAYVEQDALDVWED